MKGGENNYIKTKNKWSLMGRKENDMIIELNGTDCGFAVFNCESNDFVRGNWVNNPDTTSPKKKIFKKGDIKLFNNLDNLRVHMEVKEGILNPYMYNIYLVFGNEKVSYDNIQKVGNFYEFYHNGELVYAKPINIERINCVGYLVFGDSSETDKSSENIKIIKSAANKVLLNLRSEEKVEFIKLDDNKHLTVFFKGSTLKMHICSNWQIFKLNNARKENGSKVIPFDKSVERNNSVFIYFTKDINDYSTNIEMDEKKIVFIIDKIIEYAYNVNNIEAYWSSVQLNKLITK